MNIDVHKKSPYKSGNTGREIYVDDDGRLLINDSRSNFSNFSNNIGSGLNDIVEINNIESYSTAGFYIQVPSGSNVIFEGTFDSVNWVPIAFRSLNDDTYRQNTAADRNFLGSINALNKFRTRNTSIGSTSGKITGRLSRDQAILEGIEHAQQPHKIGAIIVNKNGDFTTQQTNTVLWSPPSGFRFVLTEINLSIGGTTDGSIIIFENNNTTENQILKTYVQVGGSNVQTRDNPFRTPYVSKFNGGQVKVTSSAAITFAVHVRGFEEAIFSPL